MNTTLQTVPNLLQNLSPRVQYDVTGSSQQFISAPGILFGIWYGECESTDNLSDISKVMNVPDCRKSDSMYDDQELPSPDPMLYPLPGGEGLVSDVCGYPNRYTFLPGRIWIETYGGLPFKSHPMMLRDPRSSHQLYN